MTYLFRNLCVNDFTGHFFDAFLRLPCDISLFNQASECSFNRACRTSAPFCEIFDAAGESALEVLRKAVRELGSERRETVRSLSDVGVRDLRESVSSTKGPRWTDLWCKSCNACCRCSVAMSGTDNR